MIAAHAGSGGFQGLALLGGDAGQGQLQALTRQDQLGHGGGLYAVEALGELHHRRIAALAHGLDDVEDALVDRVVRHAFPAQQMIQVSREVRISGIESADSDRSGHSGPHEWQMLGRR
ncbi:hypothetical protein D3C80_1441180 [compost metagenome]